MALQHDGEPTDPAGNSDVGSSAEVGSAVIKNRQIFRKSAHAFPAGLA
jgi:hypothetical protein